MSIELMSKVWKSRYAKTTRNSQKTGLVRSHAKLLVMLKLADFASDEGFCFPGQTKLADLCALERETINRICKELEIDKKLIIHQRPGKPNYYTCLFQDLDSDFDEIFRDVILDHTSEEASTCDLETGDVILDHNRDVIQDHTYPSVSYPSVIHQLGAEPKVDEKKSEAKKALSTKKTSEGESNEVKQTPAAPAGEKVFKKTRKAKGAVEESDEEFLSRMKTIFAHVDFDLEKEKARSWTIRKGRDFTRAFFESWLGRVKKDTSNNILPTTPLPSNGSKPTTLLQDGEILTLDRDGKYRDQTGRVMATERESIEERFKRRQLEKQKKEGEQL